uniref:Tetraspanin n=1 Tax=Denticeps clupeoides TaxID=299321 RepID=A0AAY4D6J2_9TELE
MKVEDKIQIQKFFLMLLNTFFLILGISIFGSAAWILFDRSSFVVVISSEANVQVVASGLALIGLVAIGVTLLGCIAAHLDNRCLLSCYMGFSVVIILGQVFITFVLLLRSTKIVDFFTNKVDEAIDEYGGNNTKSIWMLLDTVQQSAKCCGMRDPSDWQRNWFAVALNESHIYPCSCSQDSTCQFLPSIQNSTHLFMNGTNIFIKGCKDTLAWWLKENYIVILAMDLGLFLMQIVLSVCIFRNIVQKSRQKLRNLDDSLEVQPGTVGSAYHQYQDYF